MKQYPPVVCVRSSQRWIHERCEQMRGLAVAHQTVRVAVEHDRGIRLVLVENETCLGREVVVLRYSGFLKTEPVRTGDDKRTRLTAVRYCGL